MAYLESFVRRTKEIELGGKKFKFAALTVRDWAKFKLYIRDQQESDAAKRREELLALAGKIENLDPEKLLDRRRYLRRNRDNGLSGYMGYLCAGFYGLDRKRYL